MAETSDEPSVHPPHTFNSAMDKPKDGDMPISESEPCGMSHSWRSGAHNRNPMSPSTRTGLPRSLTYISPSRQHSKALETGHASNLSDPEDEGMLGDLYKNKFYRTHSEFRGALEYADPEQRGKEREAMEKKERAKRRESRLDSDSWNPRKWLPGFDDTASPSDEVQDSSYRQESPASSPVVSRQVTQESPVQSPKFATAPRWSRLKSLLPHVTSNALGERQPPASAVVGKTVNITDELIAGGLSAQILRMWFERDEHGARRIPVLLHRLRIRVSDSLHPLHGTKSVFRIECEYANGAARWVIYRTLRDFVSLHTHYRVSNVYNRNINALPEFPRTSLPYFKFLKKQSRDKGRDELGRPEFARLQREALENYLVGLVRAVMFHPTSNRLSRFLEISALSIQLAQSGGSQAKAGVLRIEAAFGTKGAFAHKSLGWWEKKKPKWCAVRESYLVVLEDPGELDVFDVFMLDSEFKIERPKRVYRKGLNLLQGDGIDDDYELPTSNKEAGNMVESGGTLHSIKKGFARLLHIDHHERTGSTQSLPAPRRTQERSDTASSATDSSDEGDGSPTIRMTDPSTNVNPLLGDASGHERLDVGQVSHAQASDGTKKKKKRAKDVSRHTFYIENSQMRLKLFATTTRQMQQWITALERTAAASHWAGKNRFDSFAPIRLNVAAQWLVDGRDYFWNLSHAILLAKEAIYIHDWWLSPELQMRRPGRPNYRLDRLLERKAKEGVKIYIIVYKEVSSKTTPTDSNYTKQKLTSLHENIMVQRSPSHFQTGTFYWAHHEKMCVVDEAIAFMGGLDLCFGRWDTAQHALVDDGNMVGPEGSEYLWPGKDYSNERVVEFHTLNKPEQDMYDRTKVPRMPWHDVALQIVGQPARDLSRHFVQRWNFLLRNKNHTRFMPFLLPPPEFKSHELMDNGLTGTCELQICRSAGPWSLGTPGQVEHSIQNAYLKAIQLSEHFVYIENQFFITSTVVNDVQIENRIGDALVHRIIRAHREGTKWKAVIVIPLLPGFPSPIDQGEASAIRIILECQSRSMSRGPNSIFSKLRKEDIDPDEYITFFSLRGWGKLKGDVLTTEQVYIHSKTLIVDDRLAIIGSANINERSQRGDRDSELASVIRDTDMIDGRMDGKPYKVGRFAHTLRVRLMREHLGVDVDAMYEEDLMAAEPVKSDMDITPWDPNEEQDPQLTEGDVTRMGRSHQQRPLAAVANNLRDTVTQVLHGAGGAALTDAGRTSRQTDIKSEDMEPTPDDEALREEQQSYDHEGKMKPTFQSSLAPTLREKTVAEHRPPKPQTADKPIVGEITEGHVNNERDAETGKMWKAMQNGDSPEARVQNASKEQFGDPADASKDPQTDDKRPNSRQGKDDTNDEERSAARSRTILRRHLSARVRHKRMTPPAPAPIVDPHGFEDPICDEFFKNVWAACALHNTEIYRKVFHAIPDDLVTTWKQYKEFILHHERLQRPAKGPDPSPEPIARVPSEAVSSDAGGDSQKKASEVTEKIKEGSQEGSDKPPSTRSSSPKPLDQHEPRIRRISRPDEPMEQWERDEMEALLMQVRGHLVIYPTRFLESEDLANNFLFNTDRLLPLPIYN